MRSGKNISVQSVLGLGQLTKTDQSQHYLRGLKREPLRLNARQIDDGITKQF